MADADKTKAFIAKNFEPLFLEPLMVCAWQRSMARSELLVSNRLGPGGLEVYTLAWRLLLFFAWGHFRTLHQYPIAVSRLADLAPKTSHRSRGISNSTACTLRP